MKKTIYWIYLFVFKNKVYRVYRSIHKVNKSENRLKKARALTRMVRENESINLINYWYYRYISRDWIKYI